MRILIATIQVPFTFGGAEIHAEQLRNALVAEEIFTSPGQGHQMILNCKH